MKYGTWNVSQYEQPAADLLCRAGYLPLSARVLCSRGYDSPEKARQFLSATEPLIDPMAMKDMDKAAARLRQALIRGEHIAVYGDYDVDGITATCLLTEFLRSQGGNVSCYIPGRIEEGYGLNVTAIRALQAQGVSLIVTVDCGITANEEARYCLENGMDLIITDHHECKDDLPSAVAVVDPHRKDDTYPHRNLAGVGVAFKLAAAIVGNQEIILERFSDLLCLGTVADVMPLLGENRTFVARGLSALQREPRPGLAALMAECSCEHRSVSASVIGYTLAPRINAAGRMGQVELATELFLTMDPDRAKTLARQLCALNRQRQEVEAEIYQQAMQMLSERPHRNAIVLAGENWHQGVVGIVASRLAEEFCCPAYLICLDGDRGKASSRSYGGFNLFASLAKNSHLLESYGGHELAAGFTIWRDAVEEFRTCVEAMAEEFVASGQCRTALEIDCAVEPELLTEDTINDLERLEPCGAGCPKPVLYMDGVRVDQLSEVGGGKHLRLRLSRQGYSFGAIFFSTTALRAGIGTDDTVEIAFTPQINEYRGARSVQLNLVDIRPEHSCRCSSQRGQALYDACTAGTLRPEEAAELLPDRSEFAGVWRYLAAAAQDRVITDDLCCMSRKVSRFAGAPCSYGRLRICLDVFRERGLLTYTMDRSCVTVTLAEPAVKVNLDESPILLDLNHRKAGV